MCPPTNFEGLTRAGAVRRMLVISAPCAAGEDSSSGILSAHAGMRVVAMPNRAFPPSENRPQDLRLCDPLCKICTKKS